MPIEDEMRLEIRRLEKEISLIDNELEKLHNKMIHLIEIRKKNEHELKIFRASFGEDLGNDVQIQSNLARLLREKV